MKTKNYVIYALIDPMYSTVRYVGLSNDCEYRLRQHLSLRERNIKKITWLTGLRDTCQAVSMVILDKATNEEDAKRKEAFWIAYYRRIGAPLTNSMYPTSTIPIISMYHNGMVEFDLPAQSAEWFLERLFTSSNRNTVVVHGSLLFPTIDQVAIYVNTGHEWDWMYLILKFGRRSLEDRFISCYRYSVYGYSWAVFGDATFLDKRLQATDSEVYQPWSEMVNTEISWKI